MSAAVTTRDVREALQLVGRLLDALDARAVERAEKDRAALDAIFAGDEVLTQAGKPFSVFTPYKNAWLKRLTATDSATWPCNGNFGGSELAGVPSLDEIGFVTTDLAGLKIRPGMSGAAERLSDFRVRMPRSLRFMLKVSNSYCA